MMHSLHAHRLMQPLSHSLQILLIALLLQCCLMEATSTVRDYPLPITCTETYCPSEQCWVLNVTNPFLGDSAWSAVVEVHDTRRLWINQPYHSYLEQLDSPNRFQIKWSNNTKYRCADPGNTTTLEICISDAATASTPLVRVQHELGDRNCREHFSKQEYLDDDSCAASCFPPCYCPSSKPPVENPPQFIVISWDDAFTHKGYQKHIFRLLHRNTDIRDYCGGYPRHTFFVANDNTDYSALSHVLNFGAEYALHTVAHEDRNLTESISYWHKQIEAGIHWAERLVPSTQSKEEYRPTGFRAPWLAHNKALYDALNSTGNLTYDSSLPSFSNPIWPYTLDFGAHPGCQRQNTSGPSLFCPLAGQYQGLWEFPINPLLSRSGEIFSFDPSGTAVGILHLLKDHLKHSYDTNRAPMMLSLHSTQFFKEDAHQRKHVLRNFFLSVQHEYAARGKKVIFATMRQILSWMAAGTPPSTKEELCEYFSLPFAEHAPSPEQVEVCDGWDNDGDDQFDEHVVNKCTYPSGRSDPAGKQTDRHLYTCAPCPFEYPTDEGPNRRDDGQSTVWRGSVYSHFDFVELEDGSVSFTAKIKATNSREFPSQRWYLKLKLRNISITSYYGVAPKEPIKPKSSPKRIEFSSLPENNFVEGYAEVGDVEIGGLIAADKVKRCFNQQSKDLKKRCWKLKVFFTDTN